MSSEHDRKPDDRELDEFLAGRSRIGSAYREASQQDSAPAELDAVILAHARAAVATPLRRRPRWLQPMALAATLALSLGVLLNLWRDPVTREQIAPEAAPELDDYAAPVVESAATKNEADADADLADRPAKGHLESEKKAHRQPDDERLSKSVPEKLAESVVREPAPAAPPAPAEAAQDAIGAAPALIAPKQDRPEARSALEPGQDSDAAAGASAPQAQMKSREQEPAVRRDSAREFSAPAGEWIADIRAQLARGDEAGARRALAEFRQAYPQYPLPDDLKPYAKSVK